MTFCYVFHVVFIKDREVFFVCLFFFPIYQFSTSSNSSSAAKDSLSLRWASPIGKQVTAHMRVVFPLIMCVHIYRSCVQWCLNIHSLSHFNTWICLSLCFTMKYFNRDYAFYHYTTYMKTLSKLIGVIKIFYSWTPAEGIFDLVTCNILYSAKFHFDLFIKENQNTFCVDHTVKLN